MPKIRIEIRPAEGRSVDMSGEMRLISTSEHLVNSRRHQLLSSLSRKERYELDSEHSSLSNLIPTQKTRRGAPFELNHKTLDLNLEVPKEEATIAWANSSKLSRDLEIIEERVKKMKLKVLHGRPIRNSVFN
jgi:hypothetical protein